MRQLSSLIIAVALTAGAARAAAAEGAAPAASPAYMAPRTAFGTPDLQGIWTNTSLKPSLQRPPVFKDLVATDKEAATMETLFKSMIGDLLNPKPVDPSKSPGSPPVVKDSAAVRHHRDGPASGPDRRPDALLLDRRAGGWEDSPSTSIVGERRRGRRPSQEDSTTTPRAGRLPSAA